MGDYFDSSLSARSAFGTDIAGILQTVGNRYLAENPAQPFTFRLSSRNGIRRNAEYQYVFDFDRIYPGTDKEKIVYAWAKMWSDAACAEHFKANPSGPREVYVNGEQRYRSNYYEEKTGAVQQPVRANLVRGWNSIVLLFYKTALGFGGSFGTPFFKNKPWHFLAPTPERGGQEGFIFTEPADRLPEIPELCRKESESPVKWFPTFEWDEIQRKSGRFKRIFGIRKGSFAYGWTKELIQPGEKCRIEGKSVGGLAVYAGSQKVVEKSGSGSFAAEFSAAGWVDVIAEGKCTESSDWGFQFALTQNGAACEFASPCSLQGTDDPWIYCGTFRERQDPLKLACMSRIHQTETGEDSWCADLPDMAVRPFLETKNYANWNYPVGVTLYGLMKAGRLLNRKDYADYVKQHIEACTEYYEYALWDKKTFGAPGIDAQIAAVDSLDDCGSFASSMLEMARDSEVKGYRRIADDTADYMEKKQARLPDGSLYRYLSALPEMKNTMWLDDLYMSVPFLARYYRLTGEIPYLDDAVNQFFLYREKMFLPKLKVMSHVYYTDRKLANQIPWGRGNGWVLFSLSELLQILPENYGRRAELLEFYRELCEGYLALQDEQGMWHQVLNDSESYREASCSSMFLCAFARGVRYGWLPNPQPYRAAVIKGWDGLTRVAVDRNGNLYGICRGSGHSFTPRYYKYDLNWILNDTHGIGIFLLAGVETQKMLGSEK